MIKILIMSDTHKNQVLLRKVVRKEEGITHIFHLGDCYEDLNDNLDLLENREILKVPGLYHEGYLNKSIPEKISVNVAGWNFQLVHFLNDVGKPDENLDFVLYGHTHRPGCKEIEGVYYLNPGHLKNIRTADRMLHTSLPKFPRIPLTSTGRTGIRKYLKPRQLQDKFWRRNDD